ncbi:MAG TPA: hypothetical protein VFH73_23220 [Polyangia bacterium]|jgi:hypothetical protein|nr:hypothetical protein [Polyangia bacterium]
MSWQKFLGILAAGLGAAAVALPTGPVAIAVGIGAAAAASGAAYAAHGADKAAVAQVAVIAGVRAALPQLPAGHVATKAITAVLDEFDESGHA